MIKKMIHEWVTLWTGKRFWFSLCLTSILFAVFTDYYYRQYPDEDILFYLMMADMDAPAVAVLSAAAFAYSCVYCQESRQKVRDYVMIRTGLKQYVWVRTLMGFLSGFMVFFLGKMLFIFLGSWKLPLVINGGSGYRQSTAEAWGLRNLLLHGNNVLYFVWMAAVQGMKAGIISLGAQVLSLFVNEPLVIIGFPMMFNYLVYNYLDTILKVPARISWLCIYDPTNRCCKNDITQLLYTSAYTGCLLLLLGCFSYIRIKRKIYGKKNQ